MHHNNESYITRMGLSYLGDKVIFRGKDLHKELAQKLDWFQLFLFSITGKEYTKAQCHLLQFIWSATSYPDPRIWPNAIATLGGNSHASPTLTLSATMAMSEAHIFGRKPDIRSIDFLKRALAHKNKGEDLEEFIIQEYKTQRVIYGFGRPLAKVDERLPHTWQKATELKLDNGQHIKLLKEVSSIIKRIKRQEMNIAALYAALCADIGLLPREYQLFMYPAFLAGSIPCYLEGLEKKDQSFFPIKSSDINYVGQKRRNWIDVEKV